MSLRLRTYRGATLIDVLVAMVVLAVVATAVAFMFEEAVKHFAFSSSSLTSEQQARVALTKVTVAMRQASLIVTATPDQNGQTPIPVPMPSATGAPSNQVVFYEVASLNDQDFGQNNDGEPTPCYNKVRIAWASPNPAPSPPQYGAPITEDVVPYATPCPNFTYPPTAVIANDVTSFTVTQNAGNATNGQTWNYQVDVQVTKQERVDQTPSVYQLTANVHPIMAGGQ